MGCTHEEFAKQLLFPVAIDSCFELLVHLGVSSDFNHPFHQTQKCLAMAEKIWQFVHVCNPYTRLKCMFLTNVAPVKREMKGHEALLQQSKECFKISLLKVLVFFSVYYEDNI